MANGKRKTGRKILIFSVLGLTVIGLGTWAFLRKREVTTIVQVEKVARRNLTELVVANGRLQPVKQAVINPEVSGEIIDLPVKEGQRVKRGDLLVKIKPDRYQAGRNLAEASYLSVMAGKSLSAANLNKAQVEYARFKELFENKLVSDSQFLDAKTALEVAKASFETSTHQTDQARAALDQAEEDLRKTTIVAPIDGTVTRLRSQLGERVVGTAMMAGTEIMTIADLDLMEARVDIGEKDLPLIALGQNARLEVDAFSENERKFSGEVSEIANASKGSALQSGGTSQEATKFEIRIRIREKEGFRPGMSVTAQIESRQRTNALSVPIQSVTTRLPKPEPKDKKSTNAVVQADNTPKDTNADVKPSTRKKEDASPKPIEVVFLVDKGRAKMVKVKPGISDDSYFEIIEGLTEGQEVVSGGFKAISRELEDDRKVKIGPAKGDEKKPGSDATKDEKKP